MRLGWFIAIGTLLVAGGCGSSQTAWVSGKVTYAGKEVPDGTLRFFPTGGTLGSGGGAAIVDGNYSISPEMAKENGMIAGAYRVSVVANRKTGRMFPHPEGTGMIEQTKMYIPQRYNQQTKLRADLEPGENAHDLVLER